MPASKDIHIRDNEVWTLFRGGTPVIRVDATGIGLFGTAPAAQQADISALTDNTGGSSDNTLVAISSSYVQVEIRNNFADLASQVNDIRTALRNLGLMA